MRDMSAFQLDISDCDSILNHVKSLGVPAYVIHAQVLEEWKPPTVGFKTMGLWWSDIYQMAEHFRDVRTRRDERRGAAYFRKKAFQSMETFAEALFTADGTLALPLRFEREGLPKMYGAS